MLAAAMNEVNSKAGRRVDGQTLVEFALTVPLLVLLLFAIIQYGFIFSTYISLRNAAAVGARYAITGSPLPSTADVQSFTRGVLGPSVQTNRVSAVNVNRNLTVGTVSGATSVQVQYNMPLIVPFVVPGRTGSTLPLSATCVSR